MATKLIEVIKEANLPKDRLQEACIKFGINISLTMKMTPKSLCSVIAVGAALSAWLASRALSFAARLQEVFQFYIHHQLAVKKSLAMWARSLLQVLMLAKYSAPTIESRKWRSRLKLLHVSPETYSFPFCVTGSVVYVKLPFHVIQSGQTVYSQSAHF